MSAWAACSACSAYVETVIAVNRPVAGEDKSLPCPEKQPPRCQIGHRGGKCLWRRGDYMPCELGERSAGSVTSPVAGRLSSEPGMCSAPACNLPLRAVTVGSGLGPPKWLGSPGRSE
ncbi:MAG: hypothetical protein NVS3B1_13810 [Marmoricola sp.]